MQQHLSNAPQNHDGHKETTKNDACLMTVDGLQYMVCPRSPVKPCEVTLR